jgi:hypothetical protein
MSDPAHCNECEAILEEFRSAYAEIEASPELRDELRAAGDALKKMIGGTEEDAERADEVLGKYQFRAQYPGVLQDPEPQHPRIHDAFGRMFKHHGRTGHWAVFRR